MNARAGRFNETRRFGLPIRFQIRRNLIGFSKKWLKERIDESPLDISVKLYSVELDSLNDSEGIANAVKVCLNEVYLEEEPKTITAYISPGTPLMAFNWGMAALTNPEMKVNIISPSDPTKGVERIPLAHDLYFSRKTQQTRVG